ncbi:uncharacterized protein LOC111637389 [Centruroides sculpturatus]|uniref:uncharacterized protein LOC111637389 n=1 Tax=Centruroides sculpturatus TaxID=218467 RepID=UPI000C6DBEE4|nr:uncharacterized protein LOC111637389 [Centruroides sculpturatus]
MPKNKNKMNPKEESENVIYLKKEIGSYLAIALAELCVKRPPNPIDFLAKILKSCYTFIELDKQMEKEKEERFEVDTPLHLDSDHSLKIDMTKFQFTYDYNTHPLQCETTRGLLPEAKNSSSRRISVESKIDTSLNRIKKDPPGELKTSSQDTVEEYPSRVWKVVKEEVIPAFTGTEDEET